MSLLSGLRRRAVPAAADASLPSADSVAIEGYDRLSDRKVRARFYERRLRHRAGVLEEIERVHRQLRRPPDAPAARSSAASEAWEKPAP